MSVFQYRDCVGFHDSVSGPRQNANTVAIFTQRTPEEREEFMWLRKKPLVEDGKEPRDIAPVVVRTLMVARSTEAHLQ